MASDKTFNIQVYDQDGTAFLKTYQARNDPSFSARINGCLGELVLDLPLPFDDFDEGGSVDFMNVVEVMAVTPSAPLGVRVYKGFISRYEPYLDGKEQGVRVTCLGVGSLATLSYYMSGSNYTVTHSSVDPVNIFKAVIDHFGTVWGGGLVAYDGTSIPSLVGTTVSLEFADVRHFDALGKAHAASGTDWWWSIDRDGKANFRAKAGTPAHRFTIGLDVLDLQVTKDSEGVINAVQVRGFDNGVNPFVTDVDDAVSQATYGTGSPATGKRAAIITDEGLTDNSARTQRGNKVLNDNKDAKISARLTIGPAYDLESIQVGDTCTVQNYNLESSLFGESMLIAGLSYTPDAVTIELERIDKDLGLALDSFVNG